MDLPLDASRPVRPGEELPIDRLEAYLGRHEPGFAGPLTVEQFPHGHSNLTYLLRLGEMELVLRRPPFGNQVKTAHDMSREYRVLSRLCKVFPAAPRPHLFCEDESVLGVPFYVMERRRGVILRRAPRAGSQQGQGPMGPPLDAETARRLSTTLIDHLALLHTIDYRAAGLGDLGKPEGYVGRQVAGWAERYTRSRTDDVPAMERVARWLVEHQPTESGAAIIHNDYKYDNLVLDPVGLARLVAVLDWEMATVGDPLMDLGTTLGYWVEAGDAEPLRLAATGPTDVPGSLTRRELVERYQETTGRVVPDVLFYYAFGLFKIAVILQQIYARFVRGSTRDARFARLNELVAVMSEQADRSLSAGRL